MSSDLSPKKVYEKIDTIKNDDLTERSMLSFISASITQDGLVGHNLQGFNDLIDNGLSAIMTHLFNIDKIITNQREQTEDDKKRKSFQIKINFSDLQVGKPTCTTYTTGQFSDLYPSHARLTGIPYAGPVTIAATVSLRAIYADGHVEEKAVEIPPFQIGEFPIMVGSTKCHTYNCSRAALKEMGEDPNDPTGYFIMKGGEYVVDLLENIRFNSPHIHKRMKANEHVRVEFLSQPGGAFENSSQICIRYMQNGQITFEINSIKFRDVKFPFYIIYRLFGMTSDKMIAETILFNLEDSSPFAMNMLEIVHSAFKLSDNLFEDIKFEKNREKLVQLTAAKISSNVKGSAYTSNDNAIQYLNEDLLGSPSKNSGLDKILLPHMGQTPASRINKLRYLGLLIFKMLLVHLDTCTPTDRNSYRNKRVHGSGVSLAKAFKTQVNNSIVNPIMNALKRTLKDNPWEVITDKMISTSFKTPLNASDCDLNKAMEQSITSGNKTIMIRRKPALNRVSSQALERKNILNTYSALRTVVAQKAGNSSKNTDQADMMRRVHSTYTGFICVAQSADTGESVGMRKQLAITTSVCTAGESSLLKERLLSDSQVIPLDRVSNKEMIEKDLARIFVNGEWIGACENGHELVKRYRLLRREGRIVEPYATIYEDPIMGEIEFWLDAGRLRRPLLIVDNNLEEYNAAMRARHLNGGKGEKPVFVQNIRFTSAHMVAITEGKLKMSDLVEQGIVEYITPEEHENCYIARSIRQLFEDTNNVINQYTHCDVEQSIFGLAAHMSTYGDHTQPARVTYETNQGRQTGGWYALNFPYRTDKNRFFQYYNDVPLVKTITHNLVPANGSNIMIAYASYGGDNQEDSAIVNQASADRGLFAGAFFRFEKAELEKNEYFRNPDILKTKGIKPNARYDKLIDGFIKVGSRVQEGDVLIGKVMLLKNKEKNSTYEYQDQSIIYRLHEPATVEGVMKPRGPNDEQLGIVKLRYDRKLTTGDKMSSRSGNKSIVARIMPQSDMPFTDTGITPDLIVNTHSIPSRMTIGQLIESTMGKICARKGIIVDGTAFLPVDHFEIVTELVQLGFRYNGRERLYNGMTGTYMDAAIFMGPTTEQRLQKFVLDDEQSVAGSGPTDATTGQPLGGKHLQGGLRLGEMENWCLSSHGSMLNKFEKTSLDSDHREAAICRRCSSYCIYNPKHDIYCCKNCGELADISIVDSAKTSILLHEELAASNIRTKLILKPREFERY